MYHKPIKIKHRVQINFNDGLIINLFQQAKSKKTVNKEVHLTII